MSEIILELSDIHMRYGELDVLHGVSLAAKKGEVISMIGSSGSGKSTFLRCANLLETPWQGDIVYRGDAIRWEQKSSNRPRKPADDDQVRYLRTHLSMVFQQFNLWSHLSILDNICEAPITVLGLDRAEAESRAEICLTKVGIADKMSMYPSQLSGGQQQRAAIARALAMEPDALLFDEPTSALDPELEQEVLKVIRALADEGSTMIMVTHDMSLARDVSDQVVFLHQGVIEEQAAPDEFFGQPKSARLRQFLNASAG